MNLKSSHLSLSPRGYSPEPTSLANKKFYTSRGPHSSPSEGRSQWVTPNLFISRELLGSLLQSSTMCRYHFPPEHGDGSSCLFDSVATRMIHLEACLPCTWLPNTVPSHHETKCHLFSPKQAWFSGSDTSQLQRVGQVVYK